MDELFTLGKYVCVCVCGEGELWNGIKREKRERRKMDGRKKGGEREEKREGKGEREEGKKEQRKWKKVKEEKEGEKRNEGGK